MCYLVFISIVNGPIARSNHETFRLNRILKLAEWMKRPLFPHSVSTKWNKWLIVLVIALIKKQFCSAIESFSEHHRLLQAEWLKNCLLYQFFICTIWLFVYLIFYFSYKLPSISTRSIALFTNWKIVVFQILFIFFKDRLQHFPHPNNPNKVNWIDLHDVKLLWLASNMFAWNGVSS